MVIQLLVALIVRFGMHANILDNITSTFYYYIQMMELLEEMAINNIYIKQKNIYILVYQLLPTIML